MLGRGEWSEIEKILESNIFACGGGSKTCGKPHVGDGVLASGESHVLSCSRVARKRKDREGTRAEVRGYLAHKKEESKRFTRKKVDQGWSETCGQPHVGERVLASGESHVLQPAVEPTWHTEDSHDQIMALAVK